MPRDPDTGSLEIYNLSSEYRRDINHLYDKVAAVESKLERISGQLSVTLPRIEEGLSTRRPSKISLAPATTSDKKLVAALITTITLLVTVLAKVLEKALEAL